ncbi:type III secretion system export apparatus subunit SctU [Verrucomicrobium sp. BvORR106]|uniref:type III secretion system export apparatus subunit SctU n=1 Tax=Verrucomicrobium sp. BvORR106 TaxID=1403819 RepID=UPI00056FA4B4|nr:type III secretion system export apparatus subunit SctU [Verrucomicrobium sp. BvORR106]
MSEKNEPPTPKKLRDARKKGQVAKSQDVGTAALTIASFVTIGIMWPSMVEQAKELILLPVQYYHKPFAQGSMELMLAIGRKILLMSMPILMVVMVVGLAAGFGQIGFMLTFEPLKPELKKLNPMDKAKQIFSMKSLVELLKSTIKVGVIGIIIYYVTKASLDPLTRLPYGGEESVLTALQPMIKALTMNVVMAYIIIAAADFFFQKYQHIKQLKMSKDEVKREYKESEGNPEIKGKRKQLAQEAAQSDTMGRTRKASVVVTNPTHLAIAIYYDENDDKMPRVLAKGEDHIARRMVEVAREEGIPVMQHIPLARALYENVDIDRFVPSDLIEPMAEVLRWLQEWKQNN